MKGGELAEMLDDDDRPVFVLDAQDRPRGILSIDRYEDALILVLADLGPEA